MSYSEGPDAIAQPVEHTVSPRQTTPASRNVRRSSNLVSRAIEQLSQLKMNEPKTSSAKSDEHRLKQQGLVTQSIIALEKSAHDQPLNTRPNVDDESSNNIVSLPEAAASFLLSGDLSYLQLSVRQQAQAWEEQVERAIKAKYKAKHIAVQRETHIHKRLTGKGPFGVRAWTNS